jgi:hypothetical protein
MTTPGAMAVPGQVLEGWSFPFAARCITLGFCSSFFAGAAPQEEGVWLMLWNRDTYFREGCVQGLGL